jgi:tRNA pseudouridine38-40 synthase
MRIKFVVAYDGTDFRGWARSPGHRTVHDTLSAAIQKVCGKEVELVGASRTDSGAHARGQVCHLDCDVPVKRWPYALNRILPTDVAICSARPVPDAFHSRFCAEDRFYRYRIRQTGRDPFAGRFAYEYGRDLDLFSMQAAAKLLVGRHDFKAFTEELDPSIQNTTRTLRDVRVYEPDPESFGSPGREVWIDIVGTAFLRGMMRRMAGALLEVGRGIRCPEEVGSLLIPDYRDAFQWPVVLPAKGLTLMRVRYGNPPIDCRHKNGEIEDELQADPQLDSDS